MLITVITLFPKLFDSVFSFSILARAQKEGKVKIRTLDLRDYGLGRHKTVDDKPYGGGVGMVLRVDVVDHAIEAARTKKGRETVVLLDPKGETYEQATAEKFSKFDHLILVCGHYEGFDERIRALCDYEISIGDYVMSGGELPAMVIAESVARLIPGVLKKKEAAKNESFSQTREGRILEAPCYTRPRVYKGKKVPAELLSGNFKNIEEYRLAKAKQLTRKRRPDIKLITNN